ncbi:MAG TPA: hypothetical protein VLM89_09645 [Phycisphaerae bacterium]|nr:hypothetical protein [Phycisphaerae bacterium]
MPIDYSCRCGAHIRLPESAGGRQARCRTCQAVFTVPNPDQDDLLTLEDLPEDLESKPAISMPPRVIIEQDDSDKQTSFWYDLIASPLVFLDAGSLLSCLMIVGVWFILPLVSWLGMFGPYAFIFVLIVQVLLAGYICAFCFNIVLSTAGGEDDLPSVSVSNLRDDLVGPLLQFIGTWMLALAPWGAVRLAVWWWSLTLPSIILPGLLVLGTAAWPAIVLTTTLGGGLTAAISPITIARIMLASPIAYLAVCLCLAICEGINSLPDLPALAGASQGVLRAIGLISRVAAPIAVILSMRIIGLYYRHYKRRFPFEAE